MGDMADFTNDCAVGHWGRDVDLYREKRRASLPVCKKCGAICTGWKQHDSGKWWLTDRGGDWHVCK